MYMEVTLRTCFFTVTLALTTACAGDFASQPTSWVRDSLGIEIVESRAPASRTGELFRIYDQPNVSIGALDGSESTAFLRIRGVLRLSDGRIVVADGATQELRYFNADGFYLRTVGGRGSGPTEFQNFARLQRLNADSVLVHDLGAGRTTIISPDGTVALTQQTGTPPTVVGSLADRAVIYTVYADASAMTSNEGYLRPEIAVMRAVPESATAELFRIHGAEEFRILDADRVFTFPAPFARPQVLVVHANHVYALLDSGDIGVFDGSGVLTRIIRTIGERQPITAEILRVYRAETLEGYDNSSPRRALHQRVFDAAPYPAYVPIYQDIRIDTEGLVWAELYRLPTERERHWRVFGAGGEWLGDVTVPTNLDVQDIGNNYILGVARDAFDVEYVHLYLLDR